VFSVVEPSSESEHADPRQADSPISNEAARRAFTRPTLPAVRDGRYRQMPRHLSAPGGDASRGYGGAFWVRIPAAIGTSERVYEHATHALRWRTDRGAERDLRT